MWIATPPTTQTGAAQKRTNLSNYCFKLMSLFVYSLRQHKIQYKWEQTNVHKFVYFVYNILFACVSVSVCMQFQLCEMFCQNVIGDGIVLNCISEWCGITQCTPYEHSSWNSWNWTSLHIVWVVTKYKTFHYLYIYICMLILELFLLLLLLLFLFRCCLSLRVTHFVSP